MKKVFAKVFSVLLIFLLVVTAVAASVSAAYLPNRSYGIARNTGTNLDGNFFRLQIKAMNSQWSSANNMRFILHTTWVAFPSSAWIECGTMHGAIQEPGSTIGFWNGSYTAQGTSSTYREYKITGPSASTGVYHTYQISRESGPSGGQYTWGVYVDYTLRRTFTTPNQYCRLPDVGLETNESLATSATWNEHSLQRINNWSWNNWTRAQTSFTQTSSASAAFANSTTGNSILTSR